MKGGAFQVPDNYLENTHKRLKLTERREEIQGEGHKPKSFTTPGVEKSSISSFIMMPVSGSRTWDPKSKFTVDVTATAMPSLSTTEMWDYKRKWTPSESMAHPCHSQCHDPAWHRIPDRNILVGVFDPVQMKRSKNAITRNEKWTYVGDIRSNQRSKILSRYFINLFCIVEIFRITDFRPDMLFNIQYTYFGLTNAPCSKSKFQYFNHPVNGQWIKGSDVISLQEVKHVQQDCE